MANSFPRLAVALAGLQEREGRYFENVSDPLTRLKAAYDRIWLPLAYALVDGGAAGVRIDFVAHPS